MPRYYLHICNGTGFVEDEEGQELADPQAARNVAVEGLRDILAGELRSGNLNTASFIEVEDEEHQWVATVSFQEAVQVTGEAPTRPKGEVEA